MYSIYSIQIKNTIIGIVVLLKHNICKIYNIKYNIQNIVGKTI